MKKETGRRAFTLVELPVVRKRGTGGFTLIELLVVIAIIILLIALFVPNLTGVLGQGRALQCASNLSHIGKGLAMHRGDRLIGQRPAIIPETWLRDLRLRVDLPQGTYLCPEDTEPHGIAAGYQDALRVDILGHPYYNEFDEESPWMCKLSQTQYAAANLQERVTFNPPPYTPDGTPNIYWWCLEDWHDLGASDFDYEDVRIKVTEQANGIVRMDFEIGVGYNVNLVDMQDNILWTKAQMGGSEPFYFNTGGICSYGMNANVSRLTSASDKIVVVDFDAAVVPTDAGAWDANPTFARHKGKMNALRMDGTVRLRLPAEIDPAEATVAKRRWLR